jgi:ssDNA-binding Zn-finger/Zn-ribbon topoisomerase 1
MNKTVQRGTVGVPPEPVEHDVQCPICGSKMRLKTSRFGLFYGCERWPACDATHGAHPTGEPLGLPADAETKRWRIRAHEAFDKLWKGGEATMTRSGAYRWMIHTLALPASEAHIGRFSKEQCERLIVALEARDQFDALNGTEDSAEVLRRRAAKRRRKQKRRGRS